MRLTGRDVDILQALYHYHILSQRQLEALFFGSDSAAQRVLRRLYEHGFVDRRFLPVVVGRSPTLYILARKGAALLHAQPATDAVHWRPPAKELSLEFLAHTMAINDVRIAVTRGAARGGMKVLNWVTESQLKADYDYVTIRRPAGKSLTVSLIPDGYFALETPYGRANLFLEVDRGTMEVDRFVNKVRAYRQYQESGAYTRRYHAQSMLVITVTGSTKRLQHLKLATEQAGGGWQFLFAVAVDVRAETVFGEPIWWEAGRTAPTLLLAPPG